MTTTKLSEKMISSLTLIGRTESTSCILVSRWGKSTINPFVTRGMAEYLDSDCQYAALTGKGIDELHKHC